MAGVRKLQGEVDRTLKAIGEHLSEFDVIWEKVAVAPTANLKEKYEADLKKEIKKLQRLRDAAKVFIAHHDIKNKKPLLDIRKVIEGKMEQFKVLEKETKTKAYSKEGLSQAVRGARGSGGEDEERREVCKAWIDEFSALLHGQMEEMEGRLEQVKADRGGKKAKSKVGPGESLEELLRSIDRHQFHLSQLADVKEKLDDESLAPEQVEGVKDSVEYYVTNNQEPDFQEDESIYDELDLGSSKEEGGEGGEDEGEGGVGGKVEEEEGAVGEEKEGEGKGAGVEEEEEEAEGKRSTSPTKAKPTPAPPSAPPRPAPIATNTKTTGVINTSKPAPTALPSPASSTSTSAKPIPTPTPTLITPITRITPTSAAAKPPLTVTPLAGAVVNGAKKPAPAVPSPMGMGGKGVESMASIVGRGGKPEERRTTTVTPLTPITSLSPPSSLTTTPKPILPSPVPSPTLPKPATAATPTVAKVEVAQSRPLLISPVMKISTAAPSPAPPSSTFSTSISSAPSTPSFTSTPSSPTRSTSSTASTSTVPISALPHAPPSRPSSSASLTPADESAYTSPTSLNPPPTSSSSFALGISAPPPSLLTASPPSSSSTSQPPPTFDPTFSFPAPPSSAATSASSPTSAFSTSLSTSSSSPSLPKERERGLIPDDYFFTLQLLDSSLHHFPHTSDTDRPKPYTPRNPYRTPPYFPSTPPPIFDDPALFEKLSVDTLFFIFYFQQGTPHQYLAARELKKQSWRYHKNFLTWFQRHDDPKLTSDEYEQGTYVYFDYESGWCQRIKADFTFEYRHLECEDIEGIASQGSQFGRG